MTSPNSNENNQNPRVVYVKEPKKPWYKRIGCMVSLTILAIIVIIILAISFAAKQVQDDADTEHAITYSITGDATDAIATYSTSDTEQAQDTGIAAGWSKDVKVKGYFGATLTATNGAQSDGAITCTISVKGKELATNTATGAAATASCNVSSQDIKDADK